MALFEKSNSFSGLVEANLRFLRRELNKTPCHGGPLMAESDLIVDSMIETCQELHAVTTNSQPAISSDLERQRGYVEIAMQISAEKISSVDVQDIAQKLDSANLDCHVETTRTTTDYCLLWDRATGYYDVTQTRPTPVHDWKGCTYFNPRIFGMSSLRETLSYYDCKGYEVSKDKCLLLVYAANKDWGYEADHCIKAVHSVLTAHKAEE